MRLRFIGILAVLAMLTLALAAPVAATHTINVTDHTLGNGFDNPCGSNAAVKINQTDIAADQHTYTFAGLDLVLVLNASYVEGELDSVTVVSISGGSAASIYVHAGEGTLLQLVSGMVVNPEKGISFVLFCIAPPSPTLSLEKVVTGTNASTTQAFSFSVDGGTAVSISASSAALQVGTTAKQYTIAEGTLPAGWSLAGIDCTGNALAEQVVGNMVTVTVGANEDVICTFTNSFLTVTAPSPSLTLDKNVTSGNAALVFGFTLNNAAITGLSSTDAPRVIATAAGSYTIVETAQSGWNLASVVCRDNATSTTLTTTAVTNGVTVTVGADQDVTCVFTNSPGGTLGGNPTPTPVTTVVTTPVRQGTLAGSLPNTAMDGSPVDQAPVVLLALLALGSLGFVAQRNIGASKNRR